MTDHAAIVREGLHACGYGSGLTVAAQRECFAALDALEAQRDEAVAAQAEKIVKWNADALARALAAEANLVVQHQRFLDLDETLTAEIRAAEAEVARLRAGAEEALDHLRGNEPGVAVIVLAAALGEEA